MIDDNGQRIQAFEFVARFESILLHVLPSQIKPPLAASVSRSLMESGVLVVGRRWDTEAEVVGFLWWNSGNCLHTAFLTAWHGMVWAFLLPGQCRADGQGETGYLKACISELRGIPLVNMKSFEMNE